MEGRDDDDDVDDVDAHHDGSNPREGSLCSKVFL